MTKPKALVLIDGSNVYFAQKRAGIVLDWVKVKSFLEDKYKVLEFRYYVGMRRNDQKIDGFLSKIQKIGFKLVTKPVKTIIDINGHTKEKANFDVEITADALTFERKYNTLVLFSGDSDFVYLIDILKKRKQKMVVFSTRKTLAWELKLKANYFLLEKIPSLTKEVNFVRIT